MTAVVEINAKLAIGELVNGPTHALLSVILHMTHVGNNHVAAKVLDHFGQLVCALIAARNLRPQVANILRNISHRICVVGEDVGKFIFEKHPFANQLHVVE